MAYWDTPIGLGYYFRVDTWQARKDEAKNQSVNAWNIGIVRGPGTGRWGSNASTANYWANGVQIWSGAFTYDFRGMAEGATLIIASGEYTVTHNNDGTKTSVVAGNFWDGSGNFSNASSGDQYLTQTPIPRATTPAWSGNFETGTEKLISLPRASSSFTHDVSWSFGGKSGTIATGAGVTAAWTPDHSLLTEIPNAASGTGTLTVVTKNGSSVVGSKSVAFTLAAAASIVPSVTSVVWDDQNTTVKGNIGAHVQGLSQLVGTVFANGVHGSTIASKRLIVDGVQRDEGTPFLLEKSGSIAASGAATDSRGRIGSLAANLTLLPYVPPTITSLSVIRTDAAGVAADAGKYLRVILKAAVQSLLVGGVQKNSMTIKVRTRELGGAWTARNTITAPLTYDNGFAVTGGAVFLDSNAYEVQVEVADKAGQLSYRDWTVAQGGVPVVHFQGQRTGLNRYNPRGTLDVGGDAYAENLHSDADVFAADNVFAGGAVLCPIGSIMLWMTDTPPQGWVFMQGQAISRTTHSKLYALWGTTFGAGDGSTTFNVDDWRDRVPVGKSSSTEFNALGKKYGTKTHTLTVSEMPSHDHPPAAGSNNFWGWSGGGGGEGTALPGSATVAGKPTTGSRGGGQPHNNIQPSVAANYIVRAL